MFKLSHLLVVAGISASVYDFAEAKTVPTITALVGDTVDVSIAGTAVANPSSFTITSNILSPAGTTLGGNDAADPQIVINANGELELFFPQGIPAGGTTDFNFNEEVDLTLDASNSATPPYFAEGPNGNIIVSESPIPPVVDPITHEPAFIYPTISPSTASGPDYLALCDAAVNTLQSSGLLPYAILDTSTIRISIPTLASIPSYCAVGFIWTIEAAEDLPCGTNPHVCGDPQFMGFLGQSYQVHGVSDSVYNVLSTPRFQYNALFTYLDQGKCRSGTLCFSHPGNYFGQVAFLFRSSAGKISSLEVASGPVDVGLTVVLNGSPLNVSTAAVTVDDVSITFPNAFDVIVDSPDYTMKLSNSDMFINQDISITPALMSQISEFKRASKSSSEKEIMQLKSSLPHGLLGQTWERKVYANRWKYIEGTLFEYSVTDGLTGTDFKYNRF